MASRTRSVAPRSRRSLLSRLVYPLLVLAVLLVGLIVYTVVAGELRLPFVDGAVFAFERRTPVRAQGRGLPEGTVAVLACPANLPAFTKLTREHLLTAEGIHTVPVVEEAIEAHGLFRADAEGVGRLLGRVLERPKAVNFAFSENDLLPEGTRAGPSAGIPPGMRGVWIDVAELPGLADMRGGDRVDLVAAETVDVPSVDVNVLAATNDPRLRAELERAARAPRPERARSWVVARDALVVAPLRRREILVDPRRPSATSIVEEVLLAMSTADVARFSRARARSAALVVAPRSGQPEDEVREIEDSVPPDPVADLHRALFGDDETPAALGHVEIIRGGRRESVTIPRAGLEERAAIGERRDDERRGDGR